MRKLVFIGHRFYIQSGTRMSSIYEVDDTGQMIFRWDWGKVQFELSNGEEICIKPANDAQLLWAYQELERISN